MIIAKIQGGLGNQMFQYAAGRSLSHKLNVPLKIDITYYQKDKKRDYLLDNFKISASVASADEIKKLRPDSIFHRLARKFSSRKNEHKIFMESLSFNRDALNLPDNTYLEGFWQSERYFIDIGGLIREELVLKEGLPPEANSLLESIDDTDSVSIYIRRGDYTLPKYQKIFYPLGEEYYQNAVSIMNEKMPDPNFFVFSDDIEWAKTIPFPPKTTFVDTRFKLRNFEEFDVMGKCKHNIIANSTFSWWAAWLNQNPNKIVIAPVNWSIYETDKSGGLIPENWIRI